MSACDTLPMGMDMLPHTPGTWTEEEFFALDETTERVELHEGRLLVSPSPVGPHQDVSLSLAVALLPAARARKLWVRLDIDVRIAPGTIMRPDLIIADGPRVATVTAASDVLLICEITSPGNASNDRVLKMELYASAKIKWYLLIEPDMTDYEFLTARLLRLDGDRYVEHSVTEYGEELVLEEPFPIAIDTGRLFGI
ncbi:Uma2 family endonuclease [Actinoplanes sp. NPDC023936]|uniref:Uma2 family endonuclease n=1 Tax=Actinoplanes sp. NPDC023936 TaxID=3154910 RepID=UPI00340437F1